MSKVTAIAAAMVLLGAFSVEVEAAKKNKGTSSAPSAEQRKRMYEAGLKSCRKRFGARLHYVRVEKYYGQWGAVCYHY